MEARARLKEMIRNGETVVAPSAFDPLVGLLVESMGFNAVYCGGWMTGAHYGLPEGLVSLTQQAAKAASITGCISIPVICDGHEAFGEGPMVAHTVREMERAGLAAIHIEDTVSKVEYSQQHLTAGGYDILPLQAFVNKIKVALSARTDPNFTIIARTDAASANARGGSFEEAVRRAHACLELGVEVIMPILRGRAAMASFRREVPQGTLLALSFHGGLSVKQLEELGYKIIIYPAGSTMPALSAVVDSYTKLKQDGFMPFDTARAQQLWDQVNKLTGKIFSAGA